MYNLQALEITSQTKNCEHRIAGKCFVLHKQGRYFVDFVPRLFPTSGHVVKVLLTELQDLKDGRVN